MTYNEAIQALKAEFPLFNVSFRADLAPGEGWRGILIGVGLERADVDFSKIQNDEDPIFTGARNAWNKVYLVPPDKNEIPDDFVEAVKPLIQEWAISAMSIEVPDEYRPAWFKLLERRSASAAAPAASE